MVFNETEKCLDCGHEWRNHQMPPSGLRCAHECCECEEFSGYEADPPLRDELVLIPELAALGDAIERASEFRRCRLCGMFTCHCGDAELLPEQEYPTMRDAGIKISSGK